MGPPKQNSGGFTHVAGFIKNHVARQPKHVIFYMSSGTGGDLRTRLVNSSGIFSQYIRHEQALKQTPGSHRYLKSFRKISGLWGAEAIPGIPGQVVFP